MSKLAISLALLGVMASALGAVTIYVPDDYGTIQEAVNASVNGDVIVVRPGVYVENIDFIGKEITVTTEKGPTITIIDGNKVKSVATFISGEGPGTILEGFTLTNGSGSPEPLGYVSGGAIYCEGSSPIIRNNIITKNIVPAGFGAGIFLFESSPEITGNTFHENQSKFCGGGIYSRKSSPLITNNTIFNNKSHETTGGGITCSWNARPRIINNTIYKNESQYGGGIASGIGAHPIVVNNILWDNFSPRGLEIWIGDPATPATMDIDFCDVKGGISSVFLETGSTINWGTSMIDADPLFADISGDDYHLTWNSPCKDAGTNGAPGLPAIDREGDPRIVGGVADLGSDEFYTHLYCIGGIVAGNTIEIKVADSPNAGPVTLALGSGVQDPPLTTPYGDLYIQLPVVWQKTLGNIPANGILSFAGKLPGSWQSGEEYALQALIGPFSTGSYLTNLMLLVVE